jgi:glucokinase
VSSGALRLGIDLGGTKTAVSVVDAAHRVVREGVVATAGEGGVAGWAARIAAEGRRLLDGAVPEAVGVGVAGPVSPTGDLIETPNLPWPAGAPLRRSLEEVFRCPVAVENDANAALLGEHAAGAARGVRDALLVAIGTGVGAGLLVDGRLCRGVFGYAGELGHIPVPGADRPCGCGGHGHLETVAAGRGLEAVAQDAVRDAGPERAAELRRRLEAGEGTHGLFAAAEAGDAVAQEIVAAGARTLGVVLAGVITTLDPGLVILSGGLARAGYGYMDRVRAAADGSLIAGLRRTRWVVSELAEKAGTIGAAYAAHLKREDAATGGQG